MRLAIIHYSAPPVIGGVERVIAEQARALSRLGHQVTLICGNDDACVEGITVVQAQELNPQASATFAALLQEQDAVIVHNLFTMPFNLTATRRLRELAAQSPQVRWFNWVHDVAAVNPAYQHLPWDDAEHQQLKQPVPNCTNVAVSEHRCREYLDLMQLPDSACQVIPNGIEVSKILQLTPRISDLIHAQSLWERDCILLHPTRILRRKNIEFTLRVAQSLRQCGQNVICLITGAPDPHNADGQAYARELEVLGAELDVGDTVQFLGKDGALTDEDVRSLYSISDALLFPSRSEGFGLPIVEAALHGLPVFCSDIPPHRELSQAVSVFFTLEAPPESIAGEIIRHQLVADRRARRHHLAAALDWSNLCKCQLVPLLEAVG